MKILGRTLVILAVALVVVGATWAFSRSSYASSMTMGPQAGAFARGAVPGASASGAAGQAPPTGRVRPAGRPEGGGPGGSGGSWLFGLGEVGSNLGIIAVIVAVVTFGRRVVRRIRPVPAARRQPPTAPPSEPEALA